MGDCNGGGRVLRQVIDIFWPILALHFFTIWSSNTDKNIYHAGLRNIFHVTQSLKLINERQTRHTWLSWKCIPPPVSPALQAPRAEEWADPPQRPACPICSITQCNGKSFNTQTVIKLCHLTAKLLNAFSLKLSGNGSSISCSRSHGEDVVDANEEDEEVGEEEDKVEWEWGFSAKPSWGSGEAVLYQGEFPTDP